MRISTLALATVFALSSTFALAQAGGAALAEPGPVEPDQRQERHLPARRRRKTGTTTGMSNGSASGTTAGSVNTNSPINPSGNPALPNNPSGNSALSPSPTTPSTGTGR